MPEYIDRDHYCKYICRCNGDKCKKTKCPIFTAPTADVAPVVTRWIPVTERLPEEWVTVLVNTKFGFITTAYIDNTGKWRIAETREFMERRYITHWMPLPERPKEDER